MTAFCYDYIVNGVGYPNLARHVAQPYTPGWREFDHYWPRTVPLRLHLYLNRINQPVDLVEPGDVSHFAWYPIALGWFDFDCDYFGLLSDTVRQLLRQGRCRLLFYYHEGDNPNRMRERLDAIAEQHGFTHHDYVVISANSAADQIDNFIYFPDHELFFGYLNRKQHVGDFRQIRRQHIFTAVNRTHKNWRAAVMSDLLARGLLERSLWSYNAVANDSPEDGNPIEVASDDQWLEHYTDFLASAPYTCDTLDAIEQNDHHHINAELQSSYCQIVLETHFDADQSQGTFLTEKTFKPIKFGQPFIIVGPQGSLQALRDAGYHTFDQQLDNSYDLIADNTQRYFAVRRTIEQVHSNPNLQAWFNSCSADILHNQQLFAVRHELAVNSLLKQLSCYQL